MAQFAIKRLAAVEVQPSVSNQHELNAGRLRRGLGFPVGRTEGELSVLCYAEEHAAPLLLEGTYTLYNARENRPHRTPEYRLYYRLPGFETVALADDLLVLCRANASDEIHGLLARPGSTMHERLEHLLQLNDLRALERMIVRTAAPAGTGAALDLFDSLIPDLGTRRLVEVVEAHPLFTEAVGTERMPSTARMAQAGREISEVVWGRHQDADTFILRGLEAESELFFTIERSVGSRALDQMMQRGNVELDEVLAWALRLQQSRKSRRGHSLQHHFGFLLQRERIPFSPQCRTEGNECPDFVIPGEAQYHDPKYPPARLRMVACKSTVRERWSQLLREAARIPRKFLLTVDTALSDELLLAMDQHNLAVFIPRRLVEEHYLDSANRVLLGSVAGLIDELLRA